MSPEPRWWWGQRHAERVARTLPEAQQTSFWLTVAAVHSRAAATFLIVAAVCSIVTSVLVILASR